MALGNAIMAGSYSTIDISTYDANGKIVDLIVKIWKDSSKEELITTVSYHLAVNPIEDTLQNEGLNELPLDPEFEDLVLIGSNPTGNAAEWSTGDIVRYWDNEGVPEWSITQQLRNDHFYYIIDEDKYARWSGLEWKRINDYFGDPEFATYFDISVLNADGGNLLKSCYDYVKTRAEFEDCIDV